MDHYTFGDFKLAADLSMVPLKSSDSMDVFRTEPDDSPDLTVRGEIMEVDALRDAKRVYDHECWELLESDSGRVLMQHWIRNRHAYGIYVDELLSGKELTVRFSPELSERFPLSRMQVVFTSSIHHHLLESGVAILHASYIDIGGEAILFTAPSGTGKSTQAELWRQFAGADIINGDRAMIRQRDGIWHAYGSPCSGSSGICLNRTLPLLAIVVLEQHSENVIERMTYPSRIRALVSATEVYPWLPEDIDLAFAIAEQVITQIPVIRLRCRPDQEAVECLKTFLEETA